MKRFNEFVEMFMSGSLKIPKLHRLSEFSNPKTKVLVEVFLL
jgi:hypothetical protein